MPRVEVKPLSGKGCIIRGDIAHDIAAAAAAVAGVRLCGVQPQCVGCVRWRQTALCRLASVRPSFDARGVFRRIATRGARCPNFLHFAKPLSIPRLSPPPPPSNMPTIPTTKPPQSTTTTTTNRFPATAQDLIKRLLTPNATYRLGNLSGGIQDIMLHPMFNEVGFDWRELYHKRMIPPHKPKVCMCACLFFF